MYFYVKKCATILFLLFFFLALSKPAAAEPPTAVSVSSQEQVNKIISVAAHESEFGTVINVWGNGKIDDYATENLESPPKIVIDIFCDAQLLETRSIDVTSRYLKIIRVGYHPKMIRLVLDINGEDIPHSQIVSNNNELIIFLASHEISDQGEEALRSGFKEEINKEIATEAQSNDINPIGTSENVPVSGKAKSTTEKADSLKLRISDHDPEIPGHETKTARQDQIIWTEDEVEKAVPSRKLIRVPQNDGRAETVLFIECLNAYGSRDWPAAIDHISHLIETYPDGKYIERAYFLLAKSYDQLYPESNPLNFNEVINRYEKAIHQFPSSVYVLDALLCIGNRYLESNNYLEAVGYYNLILKKVGYYNLIIKKNLDSLSAINALVQKANIFLLKKRREEALAVLPVLEDALFGWPDLPEITVAKTEMAKVLYAVNSFHKSLNILTELESADQENLYTYPDISLYLGYNYYQLGNSVSARENLLRFYNICPERETNHLVLAQIGDTYRDEGLNKDAAKFYELVIERYPDSEGTSISLIRLAEQQEEGTLKVERGIHTPVRIIGKEIDLPREIYKEVIHKLIYKDTENPLLPLALVKLAALYQKEKDYRKSIEAIKALLKNNPWPSLGKEIRNGLLKIVESILEEKMKEKRFNTVIEIYRSETELFPIMNSPDILLIVSRALINLNLEEVAIEIFEKADSLILEKELPPELLIVLSHDLFKKRKYEEALNRLDRLIKNYPKDKNVPDAYQLKVEILFRQKQYFQAAETLSEVLRYPTTTCKKVRILLNREKALAASGHHDNALASLEKIYRLTESCHLDNGQMYQDLGDLYLHLGYPKKAVNFFSKAKSLAKERPEIISLSLKIAQSYLELDKKEDSIAVYDQIASFNDPFWSNLAKEKIKEISFNSEMSKPMSDGREEIGPIDGM